MSMQQTRSVQQTMFCCVSGIREGVFKFYKISIKGKHLDSTSSRYQFVTNSG